MPEGVPGPIQVLTVDAGKVFLEPAIFDDAVSCRRASPAEDADVVLDLSPASRSTLPALLEAAGHDGWQPDCVLVCFPEFFPIPDDLFATDIPVAAITADWHLAISRIAGHLPLYDVVLTDSVGCAALASHGVGNVREFALYSAPEEYDHTAADVAERPVDIAFGGNVGRIIHFERARWIARLARLARRGVTVRIADGMRGAEYAAFLARSKIVFNRSIRNEFSTRCLQTLASGAVLLTERENEEVGERLIDGVEFVSYGEDDFEDVVCGLLADPDRLAAIAAAGHARAAESESYAVRAAALSAGLATVAGRRPPRNLTSRNHAGILEAQMWYEGFYLTPETIPISDRTVALLKLLAPGEEHLAHALANRLAKTFVVNELAVGPVVSDDAESLRKLVLDLYEAAAGRGTWIVPRLNQALFLHLTRRHEEAIALCTRIVDDVAACAGPDFLEGLLLGSTMVYESPYLYRERLLATLRRSAPDLYLARMKDLTAALAMIVKGDSEIHIGKIYEGMDSYAAASHLLPPGVTIATEKRARIAYASLDDGRDRSTSERSLLRSIVIDACSTLVSVSPISCELYLMYLNTCLLDEGRTEEAARFVAQYAELAEVVGGNYATTVTATLATLRLAALQHSAAVADAGEPGDAGQ